MKKSMLLLLLLPVQLLAQSFTKEEITRWENQAQQVTIIRDNYGVPHIYGKTDADAVFGLLYAQCEDDFPRVEMNYIEKLGRMAEVKGEAELYNDLLIRMIISQQDAQRDYRAAAPWLRKLCNAFADAVNFYLYKHPEKKPALLTRFEPWFPFLWTDGSIGAISIADINMAELKNFYSGEPPVAFTAKNEDPESDRQLTGSNGFAFSPKITSSGNAILYINPHVTFYFRPEVHMVSEEGLNAYGAVTWGQFFIYQGFNEHCGWMHTSSYVDAADAYREKVRKQTGGGWTYLYNGKQKQVKQVPVLLQYKSGGALLQKNFTALYTHHGPVLAVRDKQWISVKADNRITNGLIQCWQRTKAKGLADFKKTLDLQGNISNNTVYADADGNIAYWHGNRIPVRDTAFDWSKAVDGSSSATEWKGYHPIDQTLHVINPVNGWLQNCNSTPYTVAGVNSPKRSDYPRYMAPDGENFRGINAVRVLSENNTYTLDKVIKAGYDTRMAAFEVLIPALVKAFDKMEYKDTFFAYLAGPVAVLRNWDYRCSTGSVATTLAIEWGQRLLPAILQTKIVEDEEADQVEKARYFAKTASAHNLLTPLFVTIKDLEKRFGRWQLPWGEINRFQRISPDIDNKFDDNKASIPVPFASSTWGTLPSYSSRVYPGTEKRYGVHGNSFICAVEFGKRITAKSLLAGGESGDPDSPHFFDQGIMYSKGQFKDVLFYKEDVEKNVERKYRPGEALNGIR